MSTQSIRLGRQPSRRTRRLTVRIAALVAVGIVGGIGAGWVRDSGFVRESAGAITSLCTGAERASECRPGSAIGLLVQRFR